MLKNLYLGQSSTLISKTFRPKTKLKNTLYLVVEDAEE